jgi:hypothetical protein
MPPTAATFNVTVVIVVTVTDFGDLLDPGNRRPTNARPRGRHTGNSCPTLQESSTLETK